MKLSYYIVLVLLLFCATVLSQIHPSHKQPPSDEQPPHTNEPELPANPEQPTSFPTNPAQPITPTTPSSDSSSEEIMCMMISIECPGDTWSTATPKCELVCGAAPVGGLSYEKTSTIMDDFEAFFGSKISGAYVSTISAHGSQVKIQTPPESYSDYCIEVTLRSDQESILPAIFNGVRVFYTVQTPPVCSPTLCPDGTVRGCGESCDDSDSDDETPERRGHFMFRPVTVVLFVVLLSACCCVKRRRCRAKCNMNTHTTTAPVVNESNYPAQSYSMLKDSGADIVNMDYPTSYPQMPSMPHMMPYGVNGMYPVMMQAPNGVWYPVVPQPPHETSEM